MVAPIDASLVLASYTVPVTVLWAKLVFAWNSSTPKARCKALAELEQELNHKVFGSGLNKTLLIPTSRRTRGSYTFVNPPNGRQHKEMHIFQPNCVQDTSMHDHKGNLDRPLLAVYVTRQSAVGMTV